MEDQVSRSQVVCLTSIRHKPGMWPWALQQKKRDALEIFNLEQIFPDTTCRHVGVLTWCVRAERPLTRCRLGEIWRASAGGGPASSSWDPFPGPTKDHTLEAQRIINKSQRVRITQMNFIHMQCAWISSSLLYVFKFTSRKRDVPQCQSQLKSKNL